MPKEKPAAARRPRPRARLDRETVVRRAADLVNAEGWEALSLARLAKALGVRTPSLYNHVDGLPGLARELTLLSTRDLTDRLAHAALGHAGAEGVRALAQAYRAYIKGNAGVYSLGVRSAALHRPPDAELQAAQSRVLEVILAVLAPFQLSKADALHTIRGLRSVVHGFATLELAGGFGLPLDCDDSFNRLIDGYLGTLPPGRLRR